MNRLTIVVFTSILLISCIGKDKNRNNYQNSEAMKNDSTAQYGYNLGFLRKYTRVIELRKGNAALALAPEWQGRVMTSTSEGDTGFSFGWINHELIKSGKILPHINPYGGEERLWLGPEGGQYSIFFKKGDEFVYNNWQTPAFIDTIPFTVTRITDTSALFSSYADIENYSGTLFKLGIEREVTLLSVGQIIKETGIDLTGLNTIAFRSANKLTNHGKNEWKKESGLLSVWMLGMFNPSPAVTVVIPVKPGEEKELGVYVNDNYFGKISSGRLKVSGNNVCFKADGKSRGKIGISPQRTRGIMGSFDFDNNILTLLLCNLPEGEKDYVNSAWEIQEKPYSGDALNSYNDGPLADGSQMGPFYELETSSPAAALKPGESITHSQVTIHLTGDKKALDKAALKSLGISLEQIEKAFE